MLRKIVATVILVPLGVLIGSVDITPRGLVAGISGHDLPFGS